jgi:hypothetical protein
MRQRSPLLVVHVVLMVLVALTSIAVSTAPDVSGVSLTADTIDLRNRGITHIPPGTFANFAVSRSL